MSSACSRVPKAHSSAETGPSAFYFAIFFYLGVSEGFACFVLFYFRENLSLEPRLLGTCCIDQYSFNYKPWSSCLTVPKVGITGVHYHTWQIFVFNVISIFLLILTLLRYSEVDIILSAGDRNLDCHQHFMSLLETELKRMSLPMTFCVYGQVLSRIDLEMAPGTRSVWDYTVSQI